MYEGGKQSPREGVRSSQRLVSSKEPKSREESRSSDDEDKQSDAEIPTYVSNCKKKRVPVSAYHQADLPEFEGEDYESESKWLGTKIWPLDISEQRKKSLIERDRIGKGRQDSCGCQFVGSPECVKFHIREKRVKLKLELGSAFYLWKIDAMGEDVASHWTKEDENKFHHIVLSSPLSLEKYFWVELFKNFPKKGREALVSYYFNVFILQRRSIQNRSSESHINSDDEEQSGPIGNRFGAGSIFCSPKKPNSNRR